ncbi:MAG: PTS sugar transporter subunit IIA [Balneolaceae bacterium]|jgi:mannitol/fructose-specific phosphotransferase system IIA component (Ntr-type)|nr:MAG: PTS sugar transporter subunit IIA [Balneolaceae bacterium]
MKVSDLLNSGNVHHNLEAESKEQLVKAMIESLSGQLGKENTMRATRAVMERESIMSTGVGKGLGIPHAKINGIERNYAVFARLKKPLAYGSIDDQDVDLVFLLIGPDGQSSTHIKLLSRISRLMNNDQFRHAVQQAGSAEEILDIFSKEESGMQ